VRLSLATRRLFGTFEYAYPLTDGVKAFMPPQGLLLIAAYLPANWPGPLRSTRISAPPPARISNGADAVFVSGMHIQRQQMNDICRRAHGFDLPVAIGGPSVSACSGLLSIVRLSPCRRARGTPTDDLIARLAQDPSRPRGKQVVLKTNDRLPMTEFPIFRPMSWPKRKKYFLGSIQFSSGCSLPVANSATFPVSTAAIRA